ncbi:UNVERIFIED_CONTAM: hypothetical protein HDU68_009556 [Siphonaria sp. JEL0065]|nr:hypothetical protein HDU68_009556 [Siphonaria sp. JEL0065]
MTNKRKHVIADSSDEEHETRKDKEDAKVTALLSAVVPLTSDLKQLELAIKRDLEESDGESNSQLFSDNEEEPVRMDRKSVLKMLNLDKESSDESEPEVEEKGVNEEQEGQEEEDDELMYDSDGNVIDEDGNLQKGSLSKRKVIQESNEGELSGVLGGQGASSQRKRKGGGASKKELLEMRKQPEPKNKGWGVDNDSEDDPEDANYVPPGQEGDSAITSIQADSTNTDSDTPTIAPSAEAPTENNNSTNTDSEPTQNHIIKDTSPSRKAKETTQQPHKQQDPLPPTLHLKSDSTISSTHLSLLQISNRAIIRNSLDRARALQELKKPHGKGRQLTIEEEILLTEAALVESLQQENDDNNDSDDGIEIVDVVDPSVKAAQDALIAKQRRLTNTSMEQLKVSIEEKNRRLKALAVTQNKARREEEAREYAEALEAKKRKREEKKAARRGEANGDGDEGEGGGDEKQFKRIQRKKVVGQDASTQPTSPSNNHQPVTAIPFARDPTLPLPMDEDDDEVIRTAKFKKPRKSRSKLLIADDDEEEGDAEDADEEGLSGESGSEEEVEEEGDEEDGENEVELDENGFAIHKTGEIDLDDIEEISTQQILSTSVHESPITNNTQPDGSSTTVFFKPTANGGKPKKVVPGSIHHFFQQKQKQLQKESATTKTAPTAASSSDNDEDEEDPKVLNLLSGTFTRTTATKPRLGDRMKSRFDGGGSNSIAETQDESRFSEGVFGLLSGVFPGQGKEDDVEMGEGGVDNDDSDDDGGGDEEDGNDADREEGGVGDDDNASDGDEEEERAANMNSGTTSTSQSPKAITNFHEIMMQDAQRLAALTSAPAAVPAEKSKFVEAEAAESEDEFFGMGGIDGEGNEEDGPLVCSGDEDHVEDFTDIIELHRKQVFDDDTKMVENMLNDVTNGNLRKKARRNHFGKGFALSDSDDEQELLRSLKRAGAKYKLMAKDGDAEGLTGLERFASNPKTSAFAKCFVTFDSEDEKGMMSSSEEETSFASVRAQLTKDMALKLGRGKSVDGGAGLKRSGSVFSAVSRNGSTVSSVGGGGGIPLMKTKSSLEIGGERDEDDTAVVSIKKKRSILGLAGTTFGSDSDEAGPSKKARRSNVIDDLLEEDSQISRDANLAAKIFAEDVEAQEEEKEIQFGAFDVSKLMKKKPVAGNDLFGKRGASLVGSRSCVGGAVMDDDVQPLKYTSRSAAGLHRGASGTTRASISTAFIRSKNIKSPGALEKLKVDVMNSNGGVAWNRASAGGLDAKVLASSNNGGGGGGAAGGKKNTGFLVGEAARLNAVATSAAAAGSVGGAAVGIKRTGSQMSSASSQGASVPQKKAKENNKGFVAVSRKGSLLNILARKNSSI